MIVSTLSCMINHKHNSDVISQSLNDSKAGTLGHITRGELCGSDLGDIKTACKASGHPVCLPRSIAIIRTRKTRVPECIEVETHQYPIMRLLAKEISSTGSSRLTRAAAQSSQGKGDPMPLSRGEYAYHDIDATLIFACCDKRQAAKVQLTF